MPYTKSNYPDAIKKLPAHARDIWIAAFNSAYKQYKGNDMKAFAVAWSAVKAKYRKIGNKWIAKTGNEMEPGGGKDWSSIDKSKLPDSCFAYVKTYIGKSGKKLKIRKLPYKFPNGQLSRRGVAAAWAALNGARTGKPMTDVPGARAKIEKARKKLGMTASEPIFYFTDLERFSEDEGNISEIKVIPVGYWKHPQYGDIKITEEDISRFVKNFNSGIRNDLPITEGHSNGETKPAVGWFKKLINKGRDGLWAIIEWTKRGKQLLKEKAYKYFSPEFYTTYEDPETRKVTKDVLIGGAIVNRPYFKGLPAIVLSENILVNNNKSNNKNMDIEEILKKNPDELTDEEKSFLAENKESLSDEDLVKFGLKEKTQDDEKKDDTKTDTESETETKAPDETETKTEKVGSEKIVMSEEALRILESKAEKGAKAMEELNKMKIKSFVDGLTFSEHNPDGVIYPKSSDKVVKFALSLSDEQLKSFKEIMSELPKLKLFDEVGSSSDGSISYEKKLDNLITAKMKEDKSLKYREALEQVIAENPELAKKLA